MIADLIYNSRHETAHGESFQKACKYLDIPHNAQFIGVKKRKSMGNKIQNLLNLAQSDNHHEAQLAMQKAQDLMSKYNLDTEIPQAYSFRGVGKHFKRCPLWHSKIVNICSTYFYVKVLKNYDPLQEAYFFEFYGLPENIDSAEFVYNFLFSQGDPYWQKHRQRGSRKDSFLNGFYDGFELQLKKDSQACQEALIHLRNPALNSFFKELNPRTRSISYKAPTTKDLYHKGHSLGKKLGIPKGINQKLTQKRIG